MRMWSDVRGTIKAVSDNEKKGLELSAELIVQLITRREELGSQRELAARSGLKQTAIARLESQNAIPRIETFIET